MRHTHFMEQGEDKLLDGQNPCGGNMGQGCNHIFVGSLLQAPRKRARHKKASEHGGTESGSPHFTNGLQMMGHGLGISSRFQKVVRKLKRIPNLCGCLSCLCRHPAWVALALTILIGFLPLVFVCIFVDTEHQFCLNTSTAKITKKEHLSDENRLVTKTNHESEWTRQDCVNHVGSRWDTLNPRQEQTSITSTPGFTLNFAT